MPASGIARGRKLATAASHRHGATSSSNHWLAEYLTELLNVLNVLGLLLDLEPQAGGLLERICSGALISESRLREQGVYFPEGHQPATALAQQTLNLAPPDEDAE
jgi:predicted Rdx family selenoprotein